MASFQSGDILAFNFDDGEPPGLARIRIVKPTRLFVTGQLYQIEIIGIIRPSSWKKPPRLGSKREVVEGRLSTIPVAP